MRYLTFFLVIFLLIAIFFRFASFIFVLIFKFWYVSLAVGIYLYIRSKKRVKKVNPNSTDQLNPEDEVKLKEQSDVEIVDAEIIDIEDEE